MTQYEYRRGDRGIWRPVDETLLLDFLRSIELDMDEPREFLLECLNNGEIIIARGYEVRNAQFQEAQ